MKIIICSDMEGISGVVDWDHVDPEHPEYQRFRHLMTADINSAIQGAFAGGASEIVVTDGHEDHLNVIYDELDPRVGLNSGRGLPLAITQGAMGMDGAFFIGFHARYGSPKGLLSHTWSGVVRNLWLNDILMGETGLVASVLGHFDVPVLLISGDDVVCQEARDLLGNVHTAVVKIALDRLAAACLPLQEAQQIIFKKAQQAVEGLKNGDHPVPYNLSTPIRMRLELMETEMMGKMDTFPGTCRLDQTRLEYVASDMLDCYHAFREYNRLGSL